MNKIETFLNRLKEQKASAILRTQNEKAAAAAMEAAIRGGFRIVEFTLTIPGAFELIREFSKRSDLTVGAGTVLSADQAQKAAEAGAAYLVSPVVEEEVILRAKQLELPMMAGTYSPTDMWKVYRLGAQLQKLFPAPAGGPAFIKACLGPMPFLRIVPTNGVEIENAAEYLQAGAFAVGFVNNLFVADDITNGRFERIEERARKMLSATRQ